MNGPQHFRVAEGLMRQTMDKADELNLQQIEGLLGAAQVHATLALAAATAMAGYDAMDRLDRNAWDKACGVQYEATDG